jgi:aminopeptidase N
MCLLSELIVARSLAVAGRVDADPGRPFAEPGVRPNYAPDRTCRVTKLDIGLRIDPVKREVQGDTVVTLAPLPSGQLTAKLDLDDVVVVGVSNSDGVDLEYTHADGVLSVSGVPATGGTVRVLTRGRPTRGLYFTGPEAFAPDRPHMAWTQCQDEDGHYLFPCHDSPGHKQAVRLRITAPDGMQTVGNGALTEKTVGDDGFTTWTWDQPEPIPAYLVTVCVGAFTVVETTADNAGSPLPVRYLSPGDESNDRLERIFGKTPAMISFLTEQYRTPYPWARYDQVIVHDFIFGGMENVAATTLTDLVLTDDRAAIDYDSDDLIVHELAHQWFGDLVTCQDWSQGWLNEGWATYTEYVWQNHDEGRAEAHQGLLGKLAGYLGEDGRRYRRSITHYRFRSPIDMFDRHLYEKGGLVLHTLRSILGEEAFWSGTGAYLAAHKYGVVHTRDFQRAMETASGKNLDGFFQQFVHGAGHPELDVNVSWADGLLNVSVKQTQSGPNVAEIFTFPLTISVVSSAGRAHELRLPVDQRERSWAIPLGEAPDRVEVDPDMAVICAVKLKASRSLLKAALMGGSTVPVRTRAATALLDEGSAEASRALCDALRADSFWGVRAHIAGLLSKRGGAAARDALLSAVADPHPKARRAVIAALGDMRDEVVRDRLVGLAESGDDSVHVEGEILRSLGRTRDPRIFGAAERALKTDSWADTIRMRTLDGLGATRDAAALAPLLHHTGESWLPRTRYAAALALGQLAQDVESVRPEAVDRLMELAKDGPFRVRLAALNALGRGRDDRASATLRLVHQTDPDGRIARTAYEALKTLGRGRGGEAALKTLRTDVEKLTTDNRALRERLDKLEGRLPDPPKDA